jgi:hypothetical protein
MSTPGHGESRAVACGVSSSILAGIAAPERPPNRSAPLNSRPCSSLSQPARLCLGCARDRRGVVQHPGNTPILGRSRPAWQAAGLAEGSTSKLAWGKIGSAALRRRLRLTAGRNAGWQPAVSRIGNPHALPGSVRSSLLCALPAGSRGYLPRGVRASAYPRRSRGQILPGALPKPALPHNAHQAIAPRRPRPGPDTSTGCRPFGKAHRAEPPGAGEPIADSQSANATHIRTHQLFPRAAGWKAALRQQYQPAPNSDAPLCIRARI